VPLKEIWSEIEGTELEPKGKDPRSTVSAYLSTTENLESIKGRGWWIKGRPLPENKGPDALTPGPSE
jgi:hypothetical protein